MAQVYIKGVDGGETTAPTGEEAIELDDETTSTWIAIKNLISRKLRETAGPTTLSMGAVADGEYLKRSGTSIISATISSLAPAEGEMMNGKLSVTVASNNLTVALKTLAGTDPSASDPVKIVIGGTERTITAALSLTINAAANTFNAGSAELATKEIDYFTYLSWRAASSAVVILASRIPNARVYSDFSATATNEKYAAFSTAPASTDNCVVIGRFAATLSAGAGYTWTVPTFTSKNLIQRPIFSTRLLDWSPAWTNLSVGNGTLTAQYAFDLLFCYQEVDLIFGSTTSISGAVSFTPPFSNANSGAAHPLGLTSFVETGSGTTQGTYEAYASATSMRIRAAGTSTSYVKPVALSSTIPFTWGTTDEISITGKYKY